MKLDLGNLQCSQIKLTCLSDCINWRFFSPSALMRDWYCDVSLFFCLFCFVFFLLNIFSFFTKQNSGHFSQCNQIKLIWLSDWIHWKLFHPSAWLILCCYFDFFFFFFYWQKHFQKTGFRSFFATQSNKFNIFIRLDPRKIFLPSALLNEWYCDRYC